MYIDIGSAVTICTGHAYADDTKVYVSTPAEDHSDAVDRLTSCITRVRD